MARKSNVSEETVIKFKFLKAGAFSITGYGNFWPKLGVSFRQIPGYAGNYAEHGHDFDEVIELKLPSERPRALPGDIDMDDTVRTAFRIRQAEAAAAVHAANNEIRDKLYYHEGTGRIHILSDSYLDDPNAEPTPAPEPVEPTITNDTPEHLAPAEMSTDGTPRKRGRPTKVK